MRYLALATDYDGTIATHGHLGGDARRAIQRLRASGRRAVLITGRILEDLLSVCPDLDLFAAVVAENGAVLHVPSRRETELLCPPVSDALARELERRGVQPLDRGRAILATRRPHEIAVLESIRDLDLELQIVFNGDAVMVLPSGVNKGSGLRAALRELDLSIHEAVGVGNGQNDHSFLMDTAVAVGPSPAQTLGELAKALGVHAPAVPRTKRYEAIIWERSAGLEPYAAIIVPARSARLRHLRKYAEGNLGHRSFFFRGAEARMNLRAQNLTVFCELASGVDDETWLYHLRRGDYSSWLAGTIKDPDLAAEVAGVEQALELAPADSRRLVREAIDRRYMLPG